MTFKAIGFDYGGVIETSAGKKTNDSIEEILGITREQRRQAYFKHNRLFNTGQVSYDELWKIILTELGMMDKYQALLACLREPRLYQINQDILRLIDNLKNNHYKTGLLTNNQKSAMEKFTSTGLTKHFDAIVVSADVGLQKPDPEIFEIFCAKLQVEPSELMYIDDAEKSLSRADEIGYCPILYTGYQDLLEKLKEQNVKFNV